MTLEELHLALGKILEEDPGKGSLDVEVFNRGVYGDERLNIIKLDTQMVRLYLG